ncbi:zinc ribbon domain-containing protein [Xanthobacter tagetidis]|uniref:Zinc ribbon domain-containing protein n=1 Tax=Xanthobacter tagetidis TaxID=60216 RepID=A0A3L7AMA0_9HYPH|nr:zinc ribbon domain-containing protein [Xanthobacter tagetidis]MBB6308940.1 hypothetical protein [Xanthobacter tagetidis]RLP80552.1 zinc ribbon domain-containing protein [Xanthobacter tagetidis]
MRLVKCTDCGAEISPRAKACLKCGAPLRRGCNRRTAAIIFGCLVAFLIIARVARESPRDAVTTAEVIRAEPAPQAVEPQIAESNLMSRDDVLRAIAAFREACRPLGGAMWADLTAVKARVQKEYAPHRLAKGWKTSIELELVVPDKPRLIPAYDERTGVIAGHHLWYDLGGGKEPGFFASKRVSQMLCGSPIDQNGNVTFAKAPGLAFIP